MTSATAIATNQTSVNESPFVFNMGAAPVIVFNFRGSGTLSSVTYALYRKKTSVASGSITPSGRTVTTPSLSLSLAGDYILYITATDGSKGVRVIDLRIFVKGLGV